MLYYTFYTFWQKQIITECVVWEWNFESQKLHMLKSQKYKYHFAKNLQAVK